jgi:diguanylate cyclase (GGDEF)-like protein/PAS domain S-box-containing protein
MSQDAAMKLCDVSIASPKSGVEEELKHVQKKYDDLCRQMDSIMMETIERYNQVVMDSEISNIIMSQVFNASNDGIWAVDRNYKVIRVNKRLLDLLNRSADEVIGHKCYELFPEACKGTGQCSMNRILNGDLIVEQERLLTFQSKKTIPFMVTTTPLSSLDQSIIGLVEAFTDITERKNAEKVMQLANQELERLATEDGLTKVSNRRRFDEYLNIEWRRQTRSGAPIALIMCDVDFFKKYNDQYGHQAGDSCLMSVASAIRTRVGRSGDLIARYGGEEFAIVMPATDAQGAWRVAENIREEVTKMRIPHGGSSTASFVTISGGVASMVPTMDLKPQMLIERADQCLYRAKKQGRNRVVVFDHSV